MGSSPVGQTYKPPVTPYVEFCIAGKRPLGYSDAMETRINA